MTTDKYETRDTKAEPSLRDVREAVNSLTGLIRNMSSQIEDIAKTTEDIHDMVSYNHNSPGYDESSDYGAFNGSEE